jgi:sugar phosphate isomerase/epimerase
MPSPLFSVCEYSTMTASFQEDLAACKSGGAQGIGICEPKLAPDGNDQPFLDQFRQSGLQAAVCLPTCLSILPLPNFPGLTDPKQRTDALIAGIRRLAAFKPAGCFCLTGSQSGLEYAQARTLVVEGLRRAARAAADLGIPLGVEPIHSSLKQDWTIITSIPEALDLIEEVGEPNLGIGFDTWHLWDTPNLLEDIRRHAQRIVGIHLSDRRNPTRGWADRVLPGAGIINLPAIFAALEAGGFRGWYDLEVLSDNGLFGNDYPDSLWKLPPAQLVGQAREGFLKAWHLRKGANRE